MKGALLAAAVVAAGTLGVARAQACTYPTAGVLSGYSGQFNGTLSITNNRIGVNMLCGGQAFLTLNALTALVRIDLPAVGSPVMIETCGSVVDTIIAAGTGCPDTNSLNFGCRAANDDPLTDFCTPGASRVQFNATTPYVYVLLQGSGTLGDYSVSFRYLAPSVTPTGTQTPSSSATATATLTPGLPPSQSGSQSPRPPSLSNTPSISDTPSNTPSNTPSPSQRPNCFDNGANYTAILTGNSGSYFHSGLVPIASGGVNYIAGTCGAVSPLATYSQHRYAIDLGDAPLGYQYTIETCNVAGLASVLDTAIMIGAGCPNSMTAFGCLAGNDDFGSGCGPNGWQSRVTVTANSRWLYLVVQGYFGSTSGQYRLTWNYALPTPSNTPTRSGTGTRTATGSYTLQPGFSPSGTSSPSWTRTPAATRSPSAGYTQTASNTGTPTNTCTQTSSPSQTPSQTPSPSQTASQTASASATLSTGATPSYTPTPTLEPRPAFLAYMAGQRYNITGTFNYALRPFVDVLQVGNAWTGYYRETFTVADATCGSGVRYATQTYVNGDFCAAVNRNRFTNVTLTCAADPFITRVTAASEPTTCAYSLTLAVDCRNNGGSLCVPLPTGTASPTLSAGATPSITASTSGTASPSRAPSATPLCPAPVTSIPVLSGLSGSLAARASDNVLGWAGTCTNSLYSAHSKAIYLINLTGFATGGSLNVNNCATTLDTVLFVGRGCPSDATSFSCVAGADGGCPSGGVGPSSVTIASTTQTIYYAIIQMRSSGSPGSFSSPVAWTYTPPTPSNSPTPSNTPSQSVTSSASMTPSSSGTATATLSVGVQASGTSSSSASSAPTPPQTPSSTATVSVTPTVTATPSATGNAVCGAPVSSMPELRGLSGSVAARTSDNVLGWQSTCTVTMYAAHSKAIYLINLTGFPIGGSLNINNCASTLDTSIWIGTGCPTSPAGFGCLAGADGGCPAGGVNPSSVTITTTQTLYYGILQMWSSGSPGAFSSPFVWTYTLPTPTSSITASNTNTATTTSSPSSSGTPTATLSAGGEPSATPSASVSTSFSPVGTPSNSPTRSGTPVPTVSPQCAARITALGANNWKGTLTGLSGATALTTMVSTDSTTPFFSSTAACGVSGFLPFSRPKHLYELNLAGAPTGGVLMLDTCAGTGTMNTVVMVGLTCPVVYNGWGCVAGNDNQVTATVDCTSTRAAFASNVTIITNSTRYFVMVTLPTSTTILPGPYTLRWRYVLPTPTATNTPSITATPTSTPSNTATSSLTPTLSAGALPSETATNTASQTPSPSNTASQTPSPSDGFTPTPTSSPLCLVSNVAARVSGLNSTAFVVLDSAANPVNTVLTPCAGGDMLTFAKQVVTVDLGPSFIPGGSLRVHTCGTGTTINTVLWVGLGCPTSAAAFQCQRGSDDGCGTQSNIVLNNWAQRYFYIMASGNLATVLGSMNIVTTYTLPTVTPSASVTASITGTPTMSFGTSPTPTASGTASISATATPTPSVDYTVDPSETATNTPTVSPTGSVSATLSTGSTPSPTTTATGSLTATPTLSASATATPQCGNLLPIAQTLAGASGTSSLVAINASFPLVFSAVTCTVTAPLGPKAVFAIDLTGQPLGYPLNIRTCGLGFTTATLIWAGYGCPTSYAAFQCTRGAGAAGTAAPCGSATASSTQSYLQVPEVTSPVVFVVVSQATGLTGTVGISYDYVLPTVTPSVTPPNTQTPSNTATSSVTSSNTGSSSVTATSTSTLSVGAQPSTTASGTASVSSTATPTTSLTGSPSTGYTESGTPSNLPTPSNTGLPGCSSLVPVRQTFTDLSGSLMAPVLAPTSVTALTPVYVSGACGSGDSINTNGKHLYQITLPDTIALGGSLEISSCNVTGGATLDGMLWVGSGCPTDLASFKCIVGNDQSSSSPLGTCASPANANQARLRIPIVTKRTYYVLAAAWSSTTGSYNLDYSYAPPTPTASITASNTGSSSNTASIGATPSITGSTSMTASNTKTSTPSIGFTASRTPTASATPSRTATSSLTASSTPSNTATASISFGASPSETPTPTGSTSVSASPTPSVTPTPTATRSAPCPPAVEVSGDTGSVSVSIPSTGAPNWSLSGCSGFTGGTGAFTKRVIKITVASQLGGSFLAQTCGGTTVDTAIWVGTGCGINSANFNCQAANDDSCSLQSSVTLSTISQATLWVFVSHYSGSAVTGNITVSWTYNAPSQTSTPSNTPTNTRSNTATRSITASGTASASLTASGTSSISESATGTPASTPSRSASAAATQSRSNTGTPSSSNTGSSSNSPSSSATGTAASTSTASPSGSSSETSTAAATASPSAAATASSSAAETATRSPAASQSGTKTRLPTQTRTRTKTATKTKTRTSTSSRTKTKTRTKTKSKTPSKRKLMA